MTRMFYRTYRGIMKFVLSIVVMWAIFHGNTNHRIVSEGPNPVAPVATKQVEMEACNRWSVSPTAPCWIAYKKGLK